MNWRPVIGREGFYEVSENGDIRGIRSRKLLRIWITPQGYATTSLQGVGCPKRTCRVHQVVAEAFIGPRNGREVNHKDGNKIHNHYQNLEYTTRQENAAHAFANDLYTFRGEKCNLTKITEAQAREIKALSKSTMTARQIAVAVGVGIYSVHFIRQGRTWKWLQ